MEVMKDFKIFKKSGRKIYTVYIFTYICLSDLDCAGWTVRSKHQQHQAHWAHRARTIIKQQRGFICSVQI